MAGGGHHSFEDFLEAQAEAQAADRRLYRYQPIPFKVRVLRRTARAALLRFESAGDGHEVEEGRRETWIPMRALRIERELQVDKETVVDLEVQRWVAHSRGWTSLEGER